jgi:hypothetical protein
VSGKFKQQVLFARLLTSLTLHELRGGAELEKEQSRANGERAEPFAASRRHQTQLPCVYTEAYYVINSALQRLLCKSLLLLCRPLPIRQLELHDIPLPLRLAIDVGPRLDRDMYSSAVGLGRVGWVEGGGVNVGGGRRADEGLSEGEDRGEESEDAEAVAGWGLREMWSASVFSDPLQRLESAEMLGTHRVRSVKVLST